MKFNFDHNFYLLGKRHKLFRTRDGLKWGLFFNNSQRRIVKQTHIGSYWVSTVFIGMPQGYDKQRTVFETMIFSPDPDLKFLHTSWVSAERGHKMLVRKYRVKNKTNFFLNRLNKKP